MTQTDINRNPHFETVTSWREARKLVSFQPVTPGFTGGHVLNSLAVYVRDYKQREVAFGDRSLEAYYEGFVFTQARKGIDEARKSAIETSYGRAPREDRISGREARVYELGPEPEANDIDPRSPAVVAWHDGEMLYLVASESLESDTLLRIANSIY